MQPFLQRLDPLQKKTVPFVKGRLKWLRIHRVEAPHHEQPLDELVFLVLFCCRLYRCTVSNDVCSWGRPVAGRRTGLKG